MWALLLIGWEAMAVRELAGLDIRFGSGVQHFFASGRTFHTPGAVDFTRAPTWGYWREQAGRYCGQWPPDPAWQCFVLTRDGAEVRFVGGDGGVVVGVIE